MKSNSEEINVDSLFPGMRHKKLPEEEIKKQVKLAKKGDEDAYRKILMHLHQYLCYMSNY